MSMYTVKYWTVLPLYLCIVAKWYFRKQICLWQGTAWKLFGTAWNHLDHGTTWSPTCPKFPVLEVSTLPVNSLILQELRGQLCGVNSQPLSLCGSQVLNSGPQVCQQNWVLLCDRYYREVAFIMPWNPYELRGKLFISGEKSLKEVEQTAQSHRNRDFNLDLSESEACVTLALFP